MKAAALAIACDVINEGRLRDALKLIALHRGKVTEEDAEAIRLMLLDHPNTSAVLAIKKEIRKNIWAHASGEIIDGRPTRTILQRWLLDKGGLG